MVVMAAKWAGKCRRCGKAILLGGAMEWTKEGGALHVTPADCAMAVEPSPLELRGPVIEDPEERMIAVELLLAHPWKAATSERYKKLPHEYSLRKHWTDDEFVWIVEYVRRTGYEKQFIGRVWIYYDIGEHQYWDCGGPIAECGLINRAVKKPSTELTETARASSPAV